MSFHEIGKIFFYANADYFTDSNAFSRWSWEKLRSLERQKWLKKVGGHKTKLYPQADKLREDLADLPNRITSYICNNDDEYRKARKNQGDGFTTTNQLSLQKALAL